MKVIFSVIVERGGFRWDETAVKKEITIEADHTDTLISAVNGAIQGLKSTISEAIMERQNMIEAEESNDDN